MHEFTRLVFEQVCSRQYSLVIGVGFAIAFLLVSIVSMSVSEPGSATYVISIVNIVSLAVVIAVGGSFIYICNKE